MQIEIEGLNWKKIKFLLKSQGEKLEGKKKRIKVQILKTKKTDLQFIWEKWKKKRGIKVHQQQTMQLSIIHVLLRKKTWWCIWWQMKRQVLLLKRATFSNNFLKINII